MTHIGHGRLCGLVAALSVRSRNRIYLFRRFRPCLHLPYLVTKTVASNVLPSLSIGHREGKDQGEADHGHPGVSVYYFNNEHNKTIHAIKTPIWKDVFKKF